MIDCPAKLTTGADLIISVDVYILPSAFTFETPSTDHQEEKPNMMFGEGMETADETTLRERKSSLLKMFEVLSLEPQCGVKLSGLTEQEEMHKDTVKNISKAKARKVTEIVGDGEEVEVEVDGELTNNDLDMIYKR